MGLKNMNNYMINLQWSEEDQFFLVTIPEFSDRVVMPCTHRENHAESIHRTANPSDG